jgi:hypothetical protein
LLRRPSVTTLNELLRTLALQLAAQTTAIPTKTKTAATAVSTEPLSPSSSSSSSSSSPSSSSSSSFSVQAAAATAAASVERHYFDISVNGARDPYRYGFVLYLFLYFWCCCVAICDNETVDVPHFISSHTLKGVAKLRLNTGSGMCTPKPLPQNTLKSPNNTPLLHTTQHLHL